MRGAAEPTVLCALWGAQVQAQAPDRVQPTARSQPTIEHFLRNQKQTADTNWTWAEPYSSACCCCCQRTDKKIAKPRICEGAASQPAYICGPHRTTKHTVNFRASTYCTCTTISPSRPAPAPYSLCFQSLLSTASYRMCSFSSHLLLYVHTPPPLIGWHGINRPLLS